MSERKDVSTQRTPQQRTPQESGESRALAPWEAALSDLDPFFAGWPFRALGRPRRLMEEVWGQGFSPAVDIGENDGVYKVTAELPGLKKDDITVELEEGRLTIRGEKRSEHEEKTERRRHVERSYGTFSRSFSLPADADADHVEAQFKEGVLTLEIRKSEKAKAKTVDIKS